jgi:hypothetical protein
LGKIPRYHAEPNYQLPGADRPDGASCVLSSTARQRLGASACVKRRSERGHPTTHHSTTLHLCHCKPTPPFATSHHSHKSHPITGGPFVGTEGVLVGVSSSAWLASGIQLKTVYVVPGVEFAISTSRIYDRMPINNSKSKGCSPRIHKVCFLQ